MKLQHHRFRFGLIGNLKVLICRIFGHRVNNDPTGFTCQRCRLAYEEIYHPQDYWIEMIEWFGSDDPDDDVYGDETPDEYLDRLVKEASPAWVGVDPEKFLNEVRGRTPAIEWKPGPPDKKGDYILITKRWPRPNWVVYEPDDESWDKDEVLWHIGPIPKTPTQ